MPPRLHRRDLGQDKNSAHPWSLRTPSGLSRRCCVAAGAPCSKLKTTLRQAVERTVEVTEQRIGALLNCSAQDNHSPRCHSTWQPNPGRGSTYRRGKTVQTTETTLEVGELSRAIGLVTSRTKSMKVRTTGLTVRFFNVMIVT